MNRCTKTSSPATLGRRSLLGALALLLGIASTTATAQMGVRNFPAKALRGTMVVQRPPIITMDGRQVRLSPGARIFGTSNTIVLSGTLVGKELTVNYLPDGMGQIHQVWLLTEAEAAIDRPRAGD